jgi:hypothetical protein
MAQELSRNNTMA